MFPDELEASFADCPAVYFPYGLCEPHGPQCTLGLDALKAHAICCAAAREHGGIVAPPDYWHIHEIGLYGGWGAEYVGETRPWLTAVPPWVHFKNVCYHARAADALGFHAAIFLTGHYGPNWKDLKTLLDILQPHLAMRLYGLPDFEANVPGFNRDNNSASDHAGRVETSLLWALEPSCVDVSRLPDDPEAMRAEQLFAMGRDAHQSNRLTGQRMVADEVRWIGQKLGHLLSDYESNRRAGHQPLSFADVEQIWRDEVKPKLRGFESMQHAIHAQPKPGSRWNLNYSIPSDLD